MSDLPALDIGAVRGASVNEHADRDDAAVVSIAGEDGKVTMTVPKPMVEPLLDSFREARRVTHGDSHAV